SPLVYAARASDVVHVIIDGRLVLKDRALLTLDAAAVAANARHHSARLTARARPPSRARPTARAR
ncbi:MAG TPA: N-ethylammeline chlorohydrolase, partial [Cystobacter sp.]